MIRAKILLLVFLFLPVFSGQKQFETQTYKRLDQLRDKKEQHLTRYFNSVRQKASSIKQDSLMLEFFKIKNEFYTIRKSSTPPANLVQSISQLKRVIDEHYLKNYLLFYDILFINKAGDIFYTVRKQADYHKNIHDLPLQSTPLAKKLKKNPFESFIDFHYYPVSDIPSAFLIEPFTENGQIQGWFALQWSINRINAMFSDNELGITGETFLVNENEMMLTDSRFSPYSSILKKHLSPENIQSKFKDGAGHRAVIDYRGNRVLSSFKVIDIFNTKWLLITKIDVNEILTNQFVTMPIDERKEFFKFLVKTPVKQTQTGVPDRKGHEVDMGEYRRGDTHDQLYTSGVSSCTAVSIALPGKFSYLAHVSPYDKIYGISETDLIGNIFRKINTLEIRGSQKKDIQCVITAPHLKSLNAALSALADEDIFLSQIKLMFNPEARYVNVFLNNSNAETVAQWRLKNGGYSVSMSSELIPVARVLEMFLK